MLTMILTLHIIVCVTLVILVLLQAGKEGMGVIFGGGNSSVFGSSGAGGMLTKMTAFMAVLFVITCLSYNIMTSTRVAEQSTILNIQLEEMPAPAAPAGAAPVTPTAPAPAVTAPAIPTAPAPAVTAPAIPTAPAPAVTAPAAAPATAPAGTAPAK